LKFAG